MEQLCFINYTSLLQMEKTGVGVYECCFLKTLHELGYSFYFGLEKDSSSKRYLRRQENRWLKYHVRVEKQLFLTVGQWIPDNMRYGIKGIYVGETCVPKVTFGCKSVAVVHDAMSVRFPEQYSLERLRPLQQFFSEIQKAHYIITFSETTKKDLIHYFNFNPKRIFVIFHGIDNKFFDCEYQSKLSLYKTAVDLKRKYVFYIGDMRPNKNLMMAVSEFVQYVKQSGVDLYFYIAGRLCFEYPKLQQYVDENNMANRVIFLGYVNEEEKHLLYKNAYCFLFPSLYEGFGIPILEAMASGTPVITSNCSAMAEVAGDAAVLTNPHEPFSIVSALRRLESIEVRTDYVRRGRIRAVGFTWEASARKFMAVIETISSK